ncbi:SLC13 family permease [Desulfovibrio legallii]|uniref:SLC13/DASS family transporter n=2 Tax=Desulfovibrio TaxID=872 RepID=A0A6H3F3R9_9BACT|nr:SLC13 family permease [Desulfovibrio legallii]RHH21790.1 SLC13/DASS family transporter [Desulfovibrio sp. AM18-2]TBH78989.1 SLC13/DASS family transporter [Desulfovibrio legallii]CAI3242504.1 Citrate transporter [Desulfovibrio diazotrophicus]
MKRMFLLAVVVVVAICLLDQDAVAAQPLGITLPEDPTKAYITLGILFVAAIMFFTEVVPLPVTALLVPIALSLTHVITSKVAFSYFGNPTVVLFMAMFIVGEATFITGFADKVGALAVRLSKGNPIKLLVYAMAAVGLLSTVLSNTGTTVVAVPMVMGMCLKAKLAPGKVLMPVAFAASLGGTVSLVGTPPNGIINSMLAQTGQTPFGFFEFGLIGVPLLAAGLIYYALIGHRFLPDRQPVDDDVVTEGAQHRRENKMWHAMIIFAFVVFMMASELMPLTTAAMLGACLMIITGCMTMREAFRSVDWTTIFLFAGMLSMSAAMDKSGAAAIVANAVVSMVHDPWMLMLVCCALTALITNFMSNTATAALMAPLALPIAMGSGISPLPIAMGIAMSASCCFLTPIATPPNTIVLGPGRYSFMDYVKAGWLLQVISLLMCWLLIPLIWPFH